MTPKQQRFVQEYLIDLNATQAAIRAGYSENGARVTGVRMLTNPNVAAAIKEAQDKRAAKTEITQEWVLECLEKVALRCMQEEAVLDSDGKQIGEYKFEHAGANRSLELIGRHLSMFTDVVEHKGLSRDERRNRLGQLLDRAGANRAPRAAGNGARGNGAGQPH